MRKPYLMSSLALGALMLAAAAPMSSAETYPKAIAHAVKSGVKVVKSFPAVSGLTGWVLAQGGRHSIVYTTADRNTLLAGMLVDGNGENLSAKYEDKHVPKPDLSGLYQSLEKNSSHVVEGTLKNPKSVMYVFVDANCPFCHYTWKALQPYEKAGLQVRWILVDTLGPTSLPKAIEVMAASDKAAAFKKMELNHGKAWSAPAQATAAAQPAVAAAIRNNNALMEQFGIGGTPGVIWKDKQGKVQVKAGMPRLSELPAMTGLPEQKMADGSLEKFR